MAESKDNLINFEDLMDSTVNIMVLVMALAMVLPLVLDRTQFARSAQQFYSTQVYTGRPDHRELYAREDLQYLNLIHDYPYTPWVTAHFLNNGPAVVEIGLNALQESFQLVPGQGVTVNKLGALERMSTIFYKTVPDGIAIIRVAAEY